MMNSHAHLEGFDTWQSSEKNPRDTSRRKIFQNIFLDDSPMHHADSHGIIFINHQSMTFIHPMDQNKGSKLLMV